ncbi:MAG: hypothetical protein LBH90_03925 [Tannerella sp.]|jgi:hypothetical protein|nr:hypothetical protein [Tannerella sp.]
MNKCFFIALIASFTCIVGLFAQEDSREKRKFEKEAYQTKRNAYITAEIGLTADEAVDFIPLDNEFKQKMFEAGKECRKLGRDSRAKKVLSDDAYLKLIDCHLDTRLKEAQIEKDYFEKFKKILSAEKLYKYMEADSRFMREFMTGNQQHNNHKKNRIPDKQNKHSSH